MWGQLLVQSVAILWLVQTTHTKASRNQRPLGLGGSGRLNVTSLCEGGTGYGAASGPSNGRGPQLNGNHPLNSGLGRLLFPSNGAGAQPGYGGYPSKGTGYGAAAVNNGGNTKGYGAVAGVMNGQGSKTQGYGPQAGPVNGQVKGNGFGAHAGVFGGHGTKGIGFGAAAGALGVNGAKHNGNGAAASTHYGFGTKGNGQGPNNNGAKPGQGAAGNKLMKGYGRPPYGSVKGPGVGMGAFRGLGAPQLGRHQGKASNGHKGYGAQPHGGYNGGYGSAGLGLGPRFGHGALKGPKQGYGGAAAQPNGQGAKPNGYGYPSGGAMKPAKAGYGASSGAAVRPQPGFGNGPVPNGHGRKPNGYGAAAGAGVQKPYAAKPKGYGGNGAALGGYGSKFNGYGAGLKPQATKGADKSLGAGAAGVVNGQLPKAAKSGYGYRNAAGASDDQSLRILSPEQLGPAPQPAMTQGVVPAVPEPTSGILVMVTPEQYQHLLSPVPQGKAYKQPPMVPQATPAPLPVLLQGKGHAPALHPTADAAHLAQAAASGPAAFGPQGNPAPQPGVVQPEGYVTGRAVPEQKGVEEEVLLGLDRTFEGGAAPEIPEALKTRAVPELDAAKSSGGVTPEETPSLGVPEAAPEGANVSNQPETGPDRLGVKGHPTGATESRGVPLVKGQGATPTNPDCDPSVPNGQWMKIPRPAAEASSGPLTKGYGAAAGTYPYGAGGHMVPGLVPGYGTGLGYAGKPKQPGYGQGAYLGAGYGNGHFHKGYGNGHKAGGQSAPAVDGKSGGAKQTPYNGAPLMPAGLDGISQFEPQSAGLGLNGHLGAGYGGEHNSKYPSYPYAQGAEKANAKYGIGGLQFAGHPGKYGYGTMAYQAQPVALGQYGLPALPYQPEHLGHSSKLGKYGGGEAVNALQGFGGEAKSSGKYGHQGGFQLPPLGSTSEGRSDSARQPVEPHSAGKPYVKGEVPTPDAAVEVKGRPVERLNNLGYINGQVQPEVVAFPAAPTPSPTLAYPSVPSYLTGESQLTPVEDLAEPAVAASLNLDSAAETRGISQEADELQQQQQPRQIHIQQHLKLQFHPQNKSWRGANDGKHDLKGFFGNSGYQG